MKISCFASIVSEKINGSSLSSRNYISTENMIPNCGGIVDSSSIPDGKVTRFLTNDILLSNIRPYFKKVWFASFDGGCSNDVICIRTSANRCLPKYLYYALCTDHFIDTFSASSKGTKMPRGDKNALLDYSIPDISIERQQHIVDILGTLDEKIENNTKKKDSLLQLYSIEYKKLIANLPKSNALFSIASVESGKRPIVKNDTKDNTYTIPIIGASSIMGFTSNYLYDEPILVIGRVGTHGIVQPIFYRSWPSDNTLVIKSPYYSFAFQVLSNIDYQSINKGSTQPLITQTDIKNTRIALPDEESLLRFETTYQMSVLNEIDIENQKINELKQLYLKKFFG